MMIFRLFYQCMNNPAGRFMCAGVFFAAMCLIQQGCSSESDPELIISDFLEKAEEAFEDRSPRALRELISNDYFDTHQRNAKEIGAVGSGYIMRSRSIHLFTDLESAFFSGDQIHSTVLAAFAARPVSSRSLLPQINADLYWFEIVLTKESGDWKLVQSSWRPAMLEDLTGD